MTAVTKTAHIATTPQIENGVGERNNKASTSSGALVIYKPPTWMRIATTSNPPSQRCVRLLWTMPNP